MIEVDRDSAGDVRSSEPEATRPSKRSERTPTACVDDKFKLRSFTE